MDYQIFLNFLSTNKPINYNSLQPNNKLYIISNSINKTDIIFCKFIRTTNKYIYLKPVDYYCKLSQTDIYV